MKRRSYTSDEGWLLSYADLITNLLVFFAMMLAAAQVSRTKMQQIAQELSGVEQPESLSSIQEKIDAQIAEEGLEELIRTDLTDQGQCARTLRCSVAQRRARPATPRRQRRRPTTCAATA